MTQDAPPRTLRIDLTAGAWPPSARTPAAGESAPTKPADAMLIVDRQGVILDAGGRVLHFFLRDRDEVCGLRLSEVAEGIDPLLLEVFWRGADEGWRILLGVVCRRKDHSGLTAEVEISKVRWGSEPVDAICLSLTDPPPAILSEEQKKSEARLIRGERLAVAGQVAGQVAHDFNNLLTPLVAYPDFIRQELPKGSPAHEFLDALNKTAADMTFMTQQLLALSRRGQAPHTALVLQEVIDQALGGLQPPLPPTIPLEVQHADGAPRVFGNKELLTRAIQNLAQNAVEAMPNGGSLRVRTEILYIDAPGADSVPLPAGEYARISISDTGHGIPDTIRAKVFEPFFTTRKPSKRRGAGLGLSIVYGIAIEHNGYIDFRTEVGKGSTFFLYLPLCHEGAAVPEPLPEPSPSAKGSVLVVDDDLRQVTVLSKYLQTLGYDPLGAESGEAALELIQGKHQTFDLVILDIIMPGMDGLETFLALRKIRPAQPIILMSGYDRAAQKVALAQRLGADRYLHKPITLEALQQAVTSALDARGEKRHAAGAPIRILVVDDDRLIRKLFSMIITSDLPAAVIDQAEDGVEAVALFAACPYELVVMDLQMPRMAGDATFLEIARICREKGWKVPAVVFCTGFDPRQSLNAIAGESSRHVILRKPVRVEDLTRAVRDSL